MFRRLNFTLMPYPIRGIFDVIFCRNAMIYFDKTLRAKHGRRIRAPVETRRIPDGRSRGNPDRDRGPIPHGETVSRPTSRNAWGDSLTNCWKDRAAQEDPQYDHRGHQRHEVSARAPMMSS